MRLALLVTLAGCRGILGIESGSVEQSDAALADAPPDAQLCFGSFVSVCLPQPPTGTITFGADDIALVCTAMVDVNGDKLCVIAADDILITTDAQLRPTGDNFVVLLARNQIEVQGTLADWSAGPAITCDAPLPADRGDGGAGGSFGTRGGSGGRSVQGVAQLAGPPTLPTTIRKGCPGVEGGRDGGAPGIGGGAITLIADTLHIAATARLHAGGTGGRGATRSRSGGGGGGTGGLIVLDAATLTIDDGAYITALGGGGGEGYTSFSLSGMDGASPQLVPTRPAPGGQGGPGTSSHGGDGSYVQLAEDGSDVLSSPDSGGGGGGGGHGVILIADPEASIPATVLPSPRAIGAQANGR